MATVTAWQTTPYGFAPLYWVQIAGVPGIFIERTTGRTLPTGFTDFEDASLVIDASAEVGTEQIDRERGIGVGLSFTFKLLDTTTVRDWMRRWTYSATLTASFTHSSTTATVDSAASWPASGSFYVGQERVTYTGKTATTFTGCSRGASGTLAQTHKPGTTAQIVTDRPRYWRGRDVTLWASFADPSGYVTGTNLTDEAIQIWKGRIEQGPERETDGFRFECVSLDRILEQPLAAKVTGDVVSTSQLIKVPQTLNFQVQLLAESNASPPAIVYYNIITISPFTAVAPGTLKSATWMREQLSSAWATKVTELGIGAQVGDLVHVKDGVKWKAKATAKGLATIYRLSWTSYLNGVQQGDTQTITYPGNMGAGNDVQLPVLVSFSDPTTPATQPPTTVTVRLTEGQASDVPSTGLVRLRAGQAACTYTYDSKAQDGNDLYLSNLKPIGSEQPLTHQQIDAKQDGTSQATAEILFSDDGDWASLALRCLMSSGTGLRSGTYDTLPQGQGYGLDDDVIDTTSFTNLLTAAPLSNLKGKTSSAGQTFVDLFGGLLGLFRMAVVSKPTPFSDQTTVKLYAVHTGAGANYATTISDIDLLSHEGDPVVSVRRADSPNVVTVERRSGGAGEPDRLLFNDNPSIEAQGRRETTYRVDATEHPPLLASAQAAVEGHFAFDQTTQALEVRVHPQVQAEVGDVVWVNLTHPALWTWSTNPGQSGYTGPGRVVGRRINLKTAQVTLTLLIDGALKLYALSPAARVLNFDVAGAPTWIDVPQKYLDHFQTAIAADGAVQVLHYQPGQAEGTGQRYTISAAALSGGNCRLTVSAQVGVFNLSTANRSTLTLPHTALVSTYQGRHAHTDDGSSWA